MTANATRLDRTNIAKLQEILGIPTGNTRGNVAISNPTGALYVKIGASWHKNSLGNDLDNAYNALPAGPAGGGRSITADNGAVEITVPDTSANAGLIVNQNDTTSNPNAIEIANAGTGTSLSFQGSTRSINSDSGNLSISTTTSGTLSINSVSQTIFTNNSNTAMVLSTEGAVGLGFDPTGGSGIGPGTFIIGDPTSTVALPYVLGLADSSTTAGYIPIQLNNGNLEINNVISGGAKGVDLYNGGGPATALLIRLASNGRAYVSDGDETLPSYSFLNGGTSGMYWNDGSSRIEWAVGASKWMHLSSSSFDVNMTGTGAISLDAAAASNLTVSGATADLTLGARGETITLNESGQTTLSGYTATSIIGVLNEMFSHFCEDIFEETIFIPAKDFIDGTQPPAALATLTDSPGKVEYRDFNHLQDEDVMIPWMIPKDISVDGGIKFRVVGFITAATAPTSSSPTEGVSFYLQGYSIGLGDQLDGSNGSGYGTAVVSKEADLYARGVDAQHDHWSTTLSSVVTVTDIAVGEVAMLNLYRDISEADDDYAQEIGVTGVLITYSRMPTGVDA